MPKPKVILVDQPRYDAAEIEAKTAAIIDRLGTEVRGKSVLVKPSFVYPSKSPVALSVITQPQLLIGVLRALKQKGAARLMVAESSVAGPSRVSFHSTGVMPLLAGLAEPVFCDEEEEVEVEVKDPFVQPRFKVPKIWLDADLFVSLPKIKTNMFAELTLTIKNNLGFLRQRRRLLYHDYRLHKKLADLFKVRQPDLTIADCVVAGEGQGPLLADPVELGLLVAGDNAVAVDRVACELCGYAPDEIEHLALLIEAGYGPGRLEDIDLIGAELLARRRDFKRPSAELHGLSPKLKVFTGTELCCPWGCAGLVRGAVDAYIKHFGPDHIQPMNLIVGKPIANVPPNLDPKITLVLGDCAEPYRDRGRFVGGCCPRPLDVGLVIREILGPMNVDVELADVMKGYLGHAAWRLKQRLSGKPLQAIENHAGASRVVKEIMIMAKFRGKMNPPQ